MVLGVLWLAGQFVAGPKVAAEVRDALMVTDILYVENGKQDQLTPYQLQGIREVRTYEPETYSQSIPAYFNDGVYRQEPGQRLEVEVKHILTLYGIGTKRVWMKYSLDTYDENGEVVRGSRNIPAKVDYHWKWYRWEVSEAKCYGNIKDSFGIGSNRILRESIKTIFGPG